MTYDLATFGEAQIRLTVAAGERLSTARALRVSPAGSEANVAGLLAQLGRSTAFASVVPSTDLGTRFMEEYRSVGVDLGLVVRVPDERIGLYFMEPALPPLSARVTYDRQHTPFRQITPDTFQWDQLLDTRVLFVTGITAALSKPTAAVVSHAVTAAAGLGVSVALDINYRSLLWNTEQARNVLEPLLPNVNILFCSRGDGEKVFGLRGDGPAVNAGLRERTGVADVVSTDGTNGVYHSGDHGQSRFDVAPTDVVDRPGAGDAFVGGTLHGYLNGNVAQGIRWGLQASKIALTHFGDLTRATAAELDASNSVDIVR